MSIITNIKNAFAFTAVLFLLTACGGGGGGTTTSTTIETPKVIVVQSSESIITENEAIIEWIENDYTSELVEYGTTEKYGSELLVKEEGTINYKQSDSELAVETVVTLSNLQAGTTYNYRIVGKDKDGNKVVSRNKTFRTSEPTPELQVPACKSGPAQQLGQIKDSISGTGLVDVTVTIDGCSTKTDTDGYYTLNNIVENNNAVVNFEKEGYFLGSTKIQIKELSGDNTTSPNYLEYAIDTYDNQWDFDSQTSVSGSHIKIAASVYTDTAGNLYSGVVSAALEIQDITTNLGKSIFPGSFEGQNTNGDVQQFVSHGLISLSFKDAKGNTLNLSESSTVTLIFNAVPSSEQENVIPLWYYDYTQGLWMEEGYAERQPDGTYQGEISRPGTWSLNKMIQTDPGIYRGRIVDEDGSPISDVRLYATGNNWISRDLSTDENGVFEIEVIPGSSFQLAAYDYQNKFGAKYNGIISAIASGEIVED